MNNIVADLACLPDEPIVSDENQKILKQIVSITRTSEFEPMGITEEKMDELVQSLKNEEEFAKEIPELTQGLEAAKAIIIEELEEEEYI